MPASQQPKETHLSEFKECITEIVNVKGKVERIENHFKQHNERLEDFSKLQFNQTQVLNEIAAFIKGSDLNGNKGLSHEFDEMKHAIKTLAEKQIKYDVYFALMGAVLIILTSGLATALFKIFIR